MHGNWRRLDLLMVGLVAVCAVLQTGFIEHAVHAAHQLRRSLGIRRLFHANVAVKGVVCDMALLAGTLEDKLASHVAGTVHAAFEANCDVSVRGHRET
jgi:hypothetical protein